MPISSVSQRNAAQIFAYSNSASNNAPAFADALRNQQASISSKTSALPASPPTGDQQTAGNSIVQVGTVSDQTPTVSQVLHNNPEFANNYWQIINSDLNKDKPFTTVQNGDVLSINQETKELFWERPAIPTGKSLRALLQEQLKGVARNADATVTLGTLDQEKPTVSQLLNSNANIKGYTWDIIEAGINQGKPYAALPEGTIVRMDPDTLELHFVKPPPESIIATLASEKKKPAPVEQKLSGLDVLKLQLQDMAQEDKPVLLGTVSDDLPTVSQVLKNNRQTHNLYKDIVYSDTNRDKLYGSLQSGTRVCINPVTLELIFQGPLKGQEAQGLPANSCLDKESAAMSVSERLHQYVAGLKTDADQQINIGTLTDAVPTVSQLLVNDPRFSGYQWDIILSDINQNKPYTKLPPGTEISINPQSLELSFTAPSLPGTTGQAALAEEAKAPLQPPPAAPATTQEQIATAPEPAAATQPAPETGKPVVGEAVTSAPAAVQPEKGQVAQPTVAETTPPPAAPLSPKESRAALPLGDTLAYEAGQLVGRPSKEIDSYQLLLKGLESRGIKYEGENGLKENLGRLAALVREDKTAMQSVDGILQVAGETVYAKTIGPHAGKEQLTEVTREMSPHLKKGLIMTLSTPTMQQSGIVSTLNNDWTLINSQDKVVDEIPVSKKITDLHDQAAAKNENLTVKVSSLQEDLLRNVDAMVGMKKQVMDPASNVAKPGMEQKP